MPNIQENQIVLQEEYWSNTDTDDSDDDYYTEEDDANVVAEYIYNLTSQSHYNRNRNLDHTHNLGHRSINVENLEKYDGDGLLRNGTYHIGTNWICSDIQNKTTHILVDLHIPIHAYYEFTYEQLHEYINRYCYINNRRFVSEFDIFKVEYWKPPSIILQNRPYVSSNVSSNDEPLSTVIPSYHYYTRAIIKTFWLRLVQRTWKRVYRERMRELGSPSYQYSIQIGRFYNSYGRTCGSLLPGLRGMLSLYKEPQSQLVH